MERTGPQGKLDEKEDEKLAMEASPSIFKEEAQWPELKNFSAELHDP